MYHSTSAGVSQYMMEFVPPAFAGTAANYVEVMIVGGMVSGALVALVEHFCIFCGRVRERIGFVVSRL